MFNENDCLVTNKTGLNYNCIILTDMDFIDKAQNGLDIAQLYCDVTINKQIYDIINARIEGTIFVAFSKEEIPSYVDSSKVTIIGNEAKEEPVNEIKTEEEIPTESLEENTDEGIDQSIFDLMTDTSEEDEPKDAKIVVYGSSKGGTGKTFTCLIAARRYAKTHPGEKVAILDGDITDPQIAITINKVRISLMSYYKDWCAGNKKFPFLAACKIPYNNFPNNVDFYLAPKDYVINNVDFWIQVYTLLSENYDVLFIDTGIDYINIPAIQIAYKIADKIVLLTTTSLKSGYSIIRQIARLKGEISSADSNGKNVYNKDMDIGSKLVLAVTGCNKSEPQNKDIISRLQKNCPVQAIFPQCSDVINKIEYKGRWDLLDNNNKFNENLDRLNNI